VPVLAVLLLLALRAGPAHEVSGDAVGAVAFHLVEEGESLIEIARGYDVGYGEIVAANPRLDPFVPEPGRVVIVPTRWIVPSAAEPGVVLLNLSEMRLYVVQRPPAYVLTFPVGIGDEGNETPTGAFRIIEKLTNPTWHPPPSIREEEPDLPESVPPGPDNPLGTHALRLSRPTILIHGTNRPWGVGRRVSHGCIRLYPEDIPRLFEAVEVGTRVLIVREPVKIAVDEGRVFVEFHHDDEIPIDYLAEATRLLAERNLSRWIDRERLAAAATERTGLPVHVGWTAR
jgi:L,D-transpeptidase ErfK/SrfK